MRKYGFRQSKFDPCMFYGERPENRRRTPAYLKGIHYVPILVDDISAYISDTSQARKNYSKFIDALDKDYPTVDMGDIEFYLKQAITPNPADSDYTISQEAHITKMLKNYDMGQCEPVSMPFCNGQMKEILRQGRDPPSDAKKDPAVDATEYHSILGSVNFPAVMTRPDIANTVSVLQRFQQSP